jgi:iron transport multicopper oxidase
VYDEAKPLPDPAEVQEFDPVDDLDLLPYDGMGLLPPPDRIVELDAVMENLGDGSNYAFFNNITYQTPKVPSLYTALTAGDKATNPRVYGDYTQAFVLEKDEIVQIVLNNLDDGRHPFHMHGHHFQVIYRGEEDSGLFEDANVPESSFPQTPMRRDTVVVWPNGNIVLRFKASNPGKWFYTVNLTPTRRSTGLTT